jgi:hypothetical protein
MKTSEVEILLQKYYEGLTSTLEETALASYFRDHPDVPGFEADRLHFEALASMRDEEIPVPEDLEAGILARLNRVQQPVRKLARRNLYVAMSAAAGLLLLVSSVMFLSRNNDQGSISDPELAYAESRQALELVSRHFNDATAKLTGLGRINSSIGPLTQLKSLDKASKSLTMLGKTEPNK